MFMYLQKILVNDKNKISICVYKLAYNIEL